MAANAAHTSAESAKAMAFDYLLTKDKDKTLTDMGNVVATGRTPGQVSKENDYIGMTPQEHTYAGEIQGDVKLGASGTAQKDVGLANVRQNYAALGNQWNIAKLEFQGKLQTARDPSHAAALMNNLTALLKDAAQGTNTPGGAGMYNAAINSTIERLAAEGIVVPIKHVDPKTGQETLGLNPDGDIKAPGFFGTMQRVPAAAADFGAGVVKRVAP